MDNKAQKGNSMNCFYTFINILAKLQIPTPEVSGYIRYSEIEEYCFKYGRLSKLKKPIKFEYALQLAKQKMKETPGLVLAGSLALILAGKIPKRDVNDIDFSMSLADYYSTIFKGTFLDHQFKGYKCLTVLGDLSDKNIYYNVFIHPSINLRTETIDGIEVQKIEDVLNYKKSFNRDKDKADLI